MAQELKLPLIHYRPLLDWKPKVGDVIIKHGWVVRTKWFGVINFIRPDGAIDVICDGMIKLLVTTAPDLLQSKTKVMTVANIKASASGTYTIMQNDTSNISVWYV